MNGWVLAGAAAAALWGWLVRPARREAPGADTFSKQLLAHRGLHDAKAGVPENSLPAFAGAVRCRVGIEVDVRLTADDRVICFHDGDLRRMCGVSGRPEERTLAELKALRLAGTDCPIPTLSELLRLVDGQVPLLIEYKAGGKNAAALCRAADAVLAGYTGPYRVESFYPSVLFWYRRHRPEVARGQLIGNVCRGARPLAAQLLLGLLLTNVLTRPDFIAADHRRFPTLGVRFCRGMGAELAVWTVTEPQELCRLLTKADTVIFEGFLPPDSDNRE